MEIDTLMQFITTNPNPACLFLAGVILGYFLRGFIVRGLVPGNRKQRPSRYQNMKAAPSTKSSSVVPELAEPSFDWTDAAVKTFASRRLTAIPVDQQRN
jgi:hypothetical protein